MSNLMYHKGFLKVTHREKVPSNETPALTGSMKMNTWGVSTLNKLFVSGS